MKQWVRPFHKLSSVLNNIVDLFKTWNSEQEEKEMLSISISLTWLRNWWTRIALLRYRHELAWRLAVGCSPALFFSRFVCYFTKEIGCFKRFVCLFRWHPVGCGWDSRWMQPVKCRSKWLPEHSLPVKRRNWFTKLSPNWVFPVKRY